MKYLVFLAVVTTAFAGILTHDVSFRPRQFELSRAGGYDIVLAPGMDLTDQPGAPQLPVQPVTIMLPGPCLVTDVRIEAGEWKPLDSDIVPYPAQRQVPLSRTDLLDAVTGPDPLVYSAATPWPARPAVRTGTGMLDGSTVVELLVYPLRYTGLTGLIEVCSGFRFAVEYTPLPKSPPLDFHEFEYVIITSTQFDSIFQRLADWKTRKGIPATIRHIDWVYANYTGRDNAEKLRNYLKTLPDSNVRYVLLGGDVNVVPFRKAYAMTSEADIDPREDSLPCDLYFADLDGDWDANHNDVFGEVADSVDLYPDLYIGRAPAENATDARAFVDKVLEYERTPAAADQNNVLFFAMVLWTDPYTDGGKHKDMLEQKSFASGYTVTKKYERMGNESRTTVMAAMRDGQNFLNHDGHGWINVISCGPTSMRTRDADTITNAFRGVLYSMGCWTTAFDFTSIGEAFVTNPNGGLVAMVGNSSYGWGSPGNPGFGYSEKFDDRFWWMIQNEGRTNIGEALAAAKAWYVPFSRGRNVYRWHEYDVNLMGDPEMPMWTAVPGSLDVVAPADIPQGNGNILVIIHDHLAPVENALVCLMKGDESYSHGYTDAAGEVWLPVSASTAGDFSLTVTAQNYLPHESTVPVAAGAFVNFAGWQVSDSLGNHDGIANPGETIALPIWMHNTGNATSDEAQLVLRTIDPCVNIGDSTASVPPLDPGDSLYIDDAFQVDIFMCPEDGRVLRFDLVVTDTAEGDPRTFYPVVQVGLPVLEFERYYYTTPPALPGETKDVRICIQNQGYGWGHDAWATLTSLDPNVTVLAPESIWFGEVAPHSSWTPMDSFRVAIESTCPASYLAYVKLGMHSEIYSFTDSFPLLVGAFGFSDDMESGDTKWTHGGTNDRWHLSTYRFHTDDHSWYCGDENGHYYYDDMDAWLITDQFMVAENCSLKFWRWFSVPNYGVDGIYVVVLRPGSTDTLDFIGTGGALGEGQDLGGFGIESDWYQQKYDLTHIPVGETIQVKVSFKSDDDGDRGEGFYIDDFEVTGGAPRVTHIVEYKTLRSTRFQVLAQPNPSPGRVMLRLVGAPAPRAAGRIFDAAGRLVREFEMTISSGNAGWTWDGNDETGRRLPAGTYFIQARSGDKTELARIVLAR